MAEQLFCTRSRTTIQLAQRYNRYTVWNDTSCVMVSLLSFHNTISKLPYHDVMFSELCNDTNNLNISSLYYYYGTWSVQCAKIWRPSHT